MADEKTKRPTQTKADNPGSAGAGMDYEVQASYDADDFLYSQVPYGEIPEVSLSALQTEDYNNLAGKSKGRTDERWHP